ncbi:DUF1707 domain-containing protein [Corynebacterium sp. 3HC-13]|uniref:DUF1707 SHOCT-like domain-containing protein n=1 Tax=Corynebacterium poyangense TaxID=2684405 RepID=UPI001CC961DE|nr:DUF1707 domain-containing protein [Corynebacterium poyangense]MBZ8176585.1 DUF1707 domain-containing protein [Corynebacterium poyangense]
MDSSHYRISDQDRAEAMEALGIAFQEGRLNVEEYDQRCQEVTTAVNSADLAELFIDIPRKTISTSGTPQRMYSSQEIDQLRHSGSRTKLGIVLTTAIVAGVAAIITDSALSPLFFAIPALVFVALYFLHLGPESWHMPSRRQLDRERLRQLKMEEKRQALEQRATRRQAQRELSTNAMNWASGMLQGKNRH